MIEKITNYLELAKERLIHQYKDKVYIESLLGSFSPQIQELENVFFDLLEKRSIDTAEGYQLDQLGKIVGQARQGMSDEEYRIRLKARIIQNTSFGEPERLITIFDMILSSNLIHLQDCGLGGVIVASDYVFSSVDELKYVVQNLELATSATVRIDAVVTFDLNEPFSFDGSVSGFGFGDDLDPNVGGKFAYENLFLFPEFIFGDDFGYSPDKNGAGFGTLDDILIGGVLL